MKSFFIKFLYLCGYLIHIFKIDLLNRIFVSIRNYIYTGIHKNKFQHFGNSCINYYAHSIKGAENISIGDNCTFESNLQLEVWDKHAKIIIGNQCLFRRNNHITAVKNVIIGDGLLTGENVLISDNSHGESNIESLEIPPRKRPIISKGGIKIGKNVWLGNNVCILSNVIIGDGVIVGANSVVTHDIPSYSIAAGIPAKIIKKIK